MTDQLDLIDPHGLAEQAGRQADWRLWLAFCETAQRAGHDAALPLTVSAGNLVVFAKWLAQGGAMPDGRIRKPHAPESIRRRLTGVLDGWREHDLDYPRGITTNARRWVDDYEAKLIERGEPTGRGKAPAPTVPDIHKIVDAIWADTSPRDPYLARVRDVSLILLSISIGGRQSELAFLDVGDITPHESGVRQESGIYVHVRKSKTGARRPKVKYGEFEATWPVQAWRRWQAAAGIVTGAAFRTVAWHGQLGGRMSGDAVSDALGRAGERAGLEVHLTGHGWTDNVLAGIGL